MCVVSCIVGSNSDPMDCIHQTPLSVEFSRQEYGVGCHFWLQRIFHFQGSKLHLLHVLLWQVNSLPLCHLGSPWLFMLLLFSHNSLQPHGPAHKASLVPHPLLKFAQVHIDCTGDAIQPSCPLMPSSPSALNLSQHQGLFQGVSCSYQMTKVLKLQLQHHSFQWVFRVDFP